MSASVKNCSNGDSTLPVASRLFQSQVAASRHTLRGEPTRPEPKESSLINFRRTGSPRELRALTTFYNSDGIWKIRTTPSRFSSFAKGRWEVYPTASFQWGL